MPPNDSTMHRPHLSGASLAGHRRLTARPGDGRLFIMAATFLGIALAIGGAGAAHPLSGLGIELLSLALIGLMAVTRGAPGDDARALLLGWGCAALVIALPLLQLVPLPHDVWVALPGRDRAAAALTLIGQPRAWSPASLDPEASWRSAGAVLPALAMFLSVLRLPERDRFRLVGMILFVGVVGSALGAAQVAAGGDPFVIFESEHRGMGTGLFVNRNHQASFLLICILLAAAAGRCGTMGWGRFPRAVAAGCMLLYAAGVLATTSRAGGVLLLLVLPTGLFILFPWKSRPSRLTLLLGGVVVVVAGGLASSAGQRVADRFVSLDDGRFLFWRDGLVMLRAFWPIGSGVGTFPNIFPAFEALDAVGYAYANHAHNEYLELVIEGGLPVILVVGPLLVLLAVHGWRRFRPSRVTERDVLGRASLIAIVVLALHSTVDYPLRMLSLMAVAGLLAAFVVAPATGVRAGPKGTASVKRRAAGWRLSHALAVALLAGLFGYRLVVAELAVQAGMAEDEPLVRSLSTQSANAAEWSATRALARDRPAEAEQFARLALRQAPGREEPLAILALARERLGDEKLTSQLMALAAQGGWRDPLAQIWLLRNAALAGDFTAAAERADALLRIGQSQQEVLAVMRGMLAYPAGRVAIANRLADRPGWRAELLTNLRSLSDAELDNQEALVMLLRTKGATVDDKEVGALLSARLDRQQYDRARDLLRRLNPGRILSLVADGQFEALAKPTPSGSPLAWKTLPVLGLAATIDAAPGRGGKQALKIRADAGLAGRVLSQLLLLEPGAYELANEMNATGSDPLRWELKCIDGRDLPLSSGSSGQDHGQDHRLASGWRTGRWSFAVPSGCDTQRLSLVITGKGATGDLWVGNVAVSSRHEVTGVE